MPNLQKEALIALSRDLEALALRARAQAGESEPLPSDRPPETRSNASPPMRAPSPGMPARPVPRGEVPVCKFGRNQGVPLTELADPDLKWLGDALQRSVDDPSKSAYRAKNLADLADVRAEQQRRSLR